MSPHFHCSPPLGLTLPLLPPSPDPNSQEASEMWMGRGGGEAGSLRSSQASLEKCKPWSAGASRVWGLGWTTMPPKGAGPPTPPCPGPRSIPAASASLPRRAAGAGRGARRLRRGRGGLLGSQSRIKYLLCFVWPLGEGRGGLSHRSGAAGKAGPGPGARAVPTPGAPRASPAGRDPAPRAGTARCGAAGPR